MLSLDQCWVSESATPSAAQSSVGFKPAFCAALTSSFAAARSARNAGLLCKLATVAAPMMRPASTSLCQWALQMTRLWPNDNPRTQFIKSDFSDIAKTVDMSVMLMGEARRGPYSVLADLMYIDTDTRNRLPGGAKLEVESKTASGFLGGGYGERGL